MRNFTFLLLLSLAAALPAAEVSWWRLDGDGADSTGENPAEWSSQGNYAEASPAPGSMLSASLQSGRHLRAGQGINFDGVTPFSACAWINAGVQDTTVMGDMISGGSYRGWELHVGTNSFGASPRGVTVWLLHEYPSNAIQVSSLVDVLDNTWRFLAFTYDGSQSGSGVKIYIDGALAEATVTLDSLSGTIANGNASEFNIGSRQNGAQHNFNGLIDEVRVFDHELSASEVATLHATNALTDVTPPSISDTVPAHGAAVVSLTTAEVEFNEAVTGVDAADLLVNGTAAASLTPLSPRRFRFTFAQPAPGPVGFTWSASHGIADTSSNAFGGAGWTVSLDPNMPQTVLISEFVASNSGGLEDEDHETPDWIEIFNPGPHPLNLDGWHLTDDPARPTRWRFPAVSLGAGQRLLVLASGKNRAVSGRPLHTNFRLSRDGGGYLAVTNASGTVAHAIESYPPQETNISFGLPPGATAADGDAALRYFLTPTPSAANPSTGQAGPAVRDVTHAPAWPEDGDAITVIARLDTRSGPVSSATLFYRVNFGAEIAVAMTGGPDGWTAVIPSATSDPGDMVRWRVAVTAGGIASRWPLNTNGNAGLPMYEGTTIRAPVSTALPVYEIFVNGYRRPGPAAHTTVDTDTGARGGFALNGVLYDNVLMRIKGTTSRYLHKRSHRVEFCRGHELDWSPDHAPQREVNLNAEYVDPSYARQYLSLWMQRAAGVGGPPHFPVRLHMNGEFWQLAFHTYAADRELIEDMGLDGRGALYKQVAQVLPGSPEKENRNWEGDADYNAFAGAISEGRSLAQRKSSFLDMADWATVINYIAVARLTQEADDVWANMVLYRDSDGSGEWRPIPFDLNLSFGQLFHDGQAWNTIVHATMDNNKSHPLYGSSACRPQYPNNPAYNGWWNRLYDVVIRDPELRALLLRRIRSLADRFYKPPGTPYAERPVEAELDALWSKIQPEAEIDRTLWGWPPVNATPGAFGVYGLGNIPPAQAVADLKNLFLDPRRTHFYTTHSVTNTNVPIGIGNTSNAGIPAAQDASPAIQFGAFETNPASGNQDEEFVELVNPNAFAADLSGWSVTGGISLVLKGGTVVPAGGSIYLSPDVASFRARAAGPRGGEGRFVIGNYQGHLSNFGETLDLRNPAGALIATVTLPATPGDAQRWLVISEIHYNPAGAGDATEFVELLNTSSDTTLDLTGVRFTAGIDFAFADGTLLASGARILVVKDIAAFRDAYPGVPATLIAGFFANDTALNNSGESLKLEDSSNSTIVEFTYADSGPWPDAADGGGPSLVLIAPQPGDAYASDGFHWRPSLATGGNPGAGDALPPPSDPAADDDQDGWANLFEYALGDSPQLAAFPSPDGTAHFSHTVRHGADVIIRAEWSEDLVNWLPATPLALAPGPVRIWQATPASSHHCSFRLRITFPPEQ